MKLRRVLSALIVVACCVVPAAAPAQNLGASAVSEFLRSIDPSEFDNDSDNSQPLASASATTSVGNATASAQFGELRSYADLAVNEIVDLNSAYSFGTASFDDVVTVGGTNVGDMAQVSLVYQVDGSLLTPFGPVSEITNYASASFNAAASSDIGFDQVIVGYDVSLFNNAPSFFALYVLTLDALVGSDVAFSAALESTAATNVNFEGVLQSDFDSTARLLGFRFEGVVDPVLTSQSGTNYAIVPEPATGVMLLLGSLLVVPCMYRKSR